MVELQKCEEYVMVDMSVCLSAATSQSSSQDGGEGAGWWLEGRIWLRCAVDGAKNTKRDGRARHTYYLSLSVSVGGQSG